MAFGTNGVNGHVNGHTPADGNTRPLDEAGRAEARRKLLELSGPTIQALVEYTAQMEHALEEDVGDLPHDRQLAAMAAIILDVFELMAATATRIAQTSDNVTPCVTQSTGSVRAALLMLRETFRQACTDGLKDDEPVTETGKVLALAITSEWLSKADAQKMRESPAYEVEDMSDDVSE